MIARKMNKTEVQDGLMAEDATEREKFEEFYQSYRRLIRGVLSNMVEASSVDDLVQETFLRAWQGLPRFALQSTVRTWVYRIAINTAIDHRRKRSLMSVVPLEDDVAQSAPGNEEETSRLVQKGLDGLEDIHRGVLVLHYFEGLDLAEIAKVLEIPTGTVKSRLHAGREKLKAYLREKGIGDENW